MNTVDEHIICHLKPYSGSPPAAYNNSENYDLLQDKTALDALAPAVETVDKACHWCCHTFPHNEKPVMIPTKRIGDSFAAMGHFCSYSCAAAFIFDQHSENNTAWTQYQHLNDLYSMEGGNKGPVVRAPPRTALAMFGGSMDIQEFRAKGDVAVVKRCSPMVVENPRMEEVPASHMYKDVYVPIDNDRIQQYKVKLQRQKPKKNFMNTLDFVLGAKN
jgi:hypothetical protein